MQNIKDLQSSNEVALSYQNFLASNAPRSTELATQRVLKILDAKYEKANLPELVKTYCSHLSSEKQFKLLEILMEFEDLFDRTLGDWDT